MPWPQSKKRVDGLNIILPIFQVLAPGVEHKCNNRGLTASSLPDALRGGEPRPAIFWLLFGPPNPSTHIWMCPRSPHHGLKSFPCKTLSLP